MTSVSDDGLCVVTYYHDEVETLNMTSETWRVEQEILQTSALHKDKVLASNKQESTYSLMKQLGHVHLCGIMHKNLNKVLLSVHRKRKKVLTSKLSREHSEKNVLRDANIA